MNTKVAQRIVRSLPRRRRSLQRAEIPEEHAEPDDAGRIGVDHITRHRHGETAARGSARYQRARIIPLRCRAAPKPEWLVRAPVAQLPGLKELMRGLNLHTVCEERGARVGEC